MRVLYGLAADKRKGGRLGAAASGLGVRRVADHNEGVPRRSGHNMADRRGDREVILEFQQIGTSVKVTAVDPVTLVEVSIVGPASAGKETLKHNSFNNLRYVLEKKKKRV